MQCSSRVMFCEFYKFQMWIVSYLPFTLQSELEECFFGSRGLTTVYSNIMSIARGMSHFGKREEMQGMNFVEDIPTKVVDEGLHFLPDYKNYQSL